MDIVQDVAGVEVNRRRQDDHGQDGEKPRRSHRLNEKCPGSARRSQMVAAIHAMPTENNVSGQMVGLQMSAAAHQMPAASG